MFLKQLRENGKALTIWCSIFVVLFSSVFLLYPSIIQESEGMMNQMLTMFPKELLDAFNMTDLASASGWVTSEGMVFLLLCGSIYSTLLGTDCVYREKKDMTIEFLATRPVTKTQIILQKSLADICCIVLFTLINCATILIGLAASKDLNRSLMLQVTLMPLTTFLVFYTTGLLVSICYKGNTGVALSIPVFFYILTVLAKLSSKVDFLQYFSPFYLSDTALILRDGQISFYSLWAALVLVAILGGCSIYAYRRKPSL